MSGAGIDSDGTANRQRNAVLIGGMHLAVGLAGGWIRDGCRDQLFNVIDLVNRLVAEAKVDRQ